MVQARRAGAGAAPGSLPRARLVAALLGCVAVLAATAPAAGQQEAGLVVERWDQPIGVVRESSPLPVVLGNERAIIVGAHDARIHAVRASDGVVVRGWPQATTSPINASPSAADTDGDGREELFVGVGTDYGQNGGFYSFASDGRRRFRFQPADEVNGNLSVHSTAAIGDVNADGRPDVTWGALGLKMWSLDAAGNVNRGWPVDTAEVVFSSPALADVDGDGVTDVIVGVHSTPSGLVDFRGGAVWALSGAGRLLWEFRTGEMMRSSPSVGDVDGDGRPEIVFGTGNHWLARGASQDAATLFVLSADGKLKWKKDLGGQKLGSPALADIDGDGVLDIAQGTWEGGDGAGHVWALRGNGSPLPGYPRESGGGSVFGGITTADLNGDGAQDVLVPTGGGMFAYSGRSGERLFALFEGQASFQNSPLAADVDCNGRLDIVVAGERLKRPGYVTRPAGGFVARFEVTSPAAGAGPRAWPMFRKDARRTGSWTNLPPGSCAPIPPLPPLPPPPVLEVFPPTVRPGEPVRIVGHGYRRTVELYLDARSASPLATVEPDDAGTFTVTLTMPDVVADRREFLLLACERDGPCPFASVEVAAPPPGWPWRVLAGIALLILAVALLRRRRGRVLDLRDGGGAGGDGRVRPPRALPPFERRVSTGFCHPGDVTRQVDELVAGRSYIFWVEIGPPVVAPAAEVSVELAVALFDYDGELLVEDGATAGAFELDARGARPLVQGATVEVTAANRELVGRRAFFPVAAPGHRGPHRLRCSFYSGNVLLQSRVVTAEVQRRFLAARLLRTLRIRRAQRPPLITSEVDFTLSRTLDPGRIARLAPHDLSVMMNHSGPATHGFRLVGSGGFQSSATFDDAELQVLGDQVRTVLHEVACEASDRLVYRYEHPEHGRLARDLVRLARCGYRIYDALVDRLAAGVPGREPPERRLAALLQGSRRIQFVNKMGARHRLPASAIYDAPLDTDLAQLTVCPEFTAALAAGVPLPDTECFRNRCPGWRARDVVCPSGFWGFRHVIGMPQSLGDSDLADLVTDVMFPDAPTLVVAVSTDEALRLRAAHEQALRQLLPGARWHRAERRHDTLGLLAATQPHVVYFYCHGGTEQGVPYLELGPPGDTVLTGDNLRAYDVYWDESHPLVFINGCHTTAVSPQTALELVTAFVQRQASGVIGTEVSVFEPLAGRFAEELLRRVIADGEPVGDAVRAARLALLLDGNPLGLVYVPFAADDLRIVRAEPEAAIPQRVGGVPNIGGDAR